VHLDNMRQWIEPEKVNISENYLYSVGGHRLVLEVLLRRGFTDIDRARSFLDTDYYKVSSPLDIPHMEKGVKRLEKAIKDQENICIWGDFDVDGQTSTTVLYSTLLNLGARVSFYIPVRHNESHGMNVAGIKNLIDNGTEIIITCDTGVTAHKEIEYAKERGVDVIVTDHHEVPSILPPAFAVINPRMLRREHPARDLPGVGCAYKLAEEMYKRAGRKKELKKYHDLVALGIISDIATQRGDTRYLLQKGIRALRKTKRVGLRAMMEVAGLKPEYITEEQIGFALSPRLNSLGRLGDANIAVEFLMTEDKNRARNLSLELEKLNEHRKILCNQVFECALNEIEQNPHLLNYSALVLSNPSWPVGVIGIVANRLVEIYDRPTILIATPPGEPGRGSARSVKGVNISSAIMAHSEKLLDFGGHPMAAGLTIHTDKISEFRKLLSVTVNDMSTLKEEKSLRIDGYATFSSITIDLYDDLQRLSPFGPGNEVPVIVTKDVIIKGHNRIGHRGDHLQLTVEDSYGNTQKVMWWQAGSKPIPKGKFDLAYYIRATNYMGQRDIQLEWVDARKHKKSVTSIKSKKVAIIDYRKEEENKILKKFKLIRDIQIWYEGEDRKEDIWKKRDELTGGENLVICTIPPGPEEFLSVLRKVCPHKIYLVGRNPHTDHMDTFLRNLISHCRHAINTRKGEISIENLAALTSHRESTVRKGIDWLAARGYINVSKINKNEFIVKEGDHRVKKYLKNITFKLRKLLEETATYRTHFSKSRKENLFTGFSQKD